MLPIGGPQASNFLQGIYDKMSSFGLGQAMQPPAPRETSETGVDSAAGPGVIVPGMENAAPPPASPFGDLGNLLGGLGMDEVDLSPSTSFSMQYAKAQFEINYQAMRTVSTENGFEMQEINFSFKASFETLNAYAGENVPNPFETEGANPIDSMMEYFSPESTAGRILDFALSFFPQSEAYAEGGDTEGARQSFADLMGNAIQKGFDEALGILGDINEKIKSDIDETHDHVFTGLDDFVQNGYDPEKSSENGQYARMQAYRMELSMSMEYTTIRSIGRSAAQESAPVEGLSLIHI